MVMTKDLHDLGRRRLAPHFTRAAAWHSEDLPIIVRGQGCYIFDKEGRRYLDGLAGLFCVTIEQVANELLGYWRLGIDEFILSGYPHVKACRRVARDVLPVLRKQIGREALSSAP